MTRKEIIAALERGQVIFVTHKRVFTESDKTTYQLDTGQTVGVRNFKAIRDMIEPAGDGLFPRDGSNLSP